MARVGPQRHKKKVYVCVFLFLCMFRSGYYASLCCSVYCLCVNVYCTDATGCQPICSYQICIISSAPHIGSYHFEPAIFTTLLLNSCLSVLDKDFILVVPTM